MSRARSDRSRVFRRILGFAARPISAQTRSPRQEGSRHRTGKGRRDLFAAGVMVGKTLYIAGKGDYRPNAEFPEKVENCLGEIRKTLQTAGLDMKHVVKSFVYLEDRDKYAEMNKILRRSSSRRTRRRGRRWALRRYPAIRGSRSPASPTPTSPRRSGSATRRRASPTAPESWRVIRSMSRARAISSPAAAIPRPSRSRSARR